MPIGLWYLALVAHVISMQAREGHILRLHRPMRSRLSQLLQPLKFGIEILLLRVVHDHLELLKALVCI